MTRRIETEGGTLIGRVDRVARKVVWLLRCPECPLEIPLTEQAFTGQHAARCECGYKTPPVGQSFPDSPVSFFDYSSALETVPARSTAA